MARRRTLIHSTLLNTASRKAFRYVSKDELQRIGLNANTKLLVPKTQKRVTKNTQTIPQAVLKAVSKTRGVNRDKALERAASKIVSLDNAASKQTVQRQKRRDASFTKAETTPGSKSGGRVSPVKQPISNTPASYRALVTIDGRAHRPLLEGSNLDKLNEHHRAIWLWLYGENDSTRALEGWERKYPDATVYDTNGALISSPQKYRRV